MKNLIVSTMLAITLGAFCGCAGPRYTAGNKQYALRGPCFTWGAVEKGRAKAHLSCGAFHPTLERIYCNRQPYHNGRHHAHRGSDCLAVWK